MAYEVSEWTDFFVATAGAAAALTGLVFVAVSINVDRILKFESLPERALDTVLLLLTPVIVSIFCLAPGQELVTIGLEVSITSAALLGVGVRLIIRPLRHASAAEHRGSQVLTLGPGPVLMLLAGLSLIAERGGGFYLLMAGFVAALIAGVLNAWVLLVEILR